MDFAKFVKKFMDRCLKDKFARAYAYDHCHKAFENYIGKGETLDEQTVDFLALHLYSFLASWGMVKGSCLLMKTHYQYLYKAVKVVCDKEYADLKDIDILSSDFDKKDYIEKVMKLKGELDKTIFAGTNYKYKDTLLGKIMLVTLDCALGYDTNVKKNVRKLGGVGALSERGLTDILEFAQAHQKEIQEAQKLYKTKKNVDYSPMKLIDGALWTM